MKIFKKTTKDKFIMGYEGDYCIRVFKDEKSFNEWKDLTDKNGHSMISFYKIDQISSFYSPLTENMFKEYSK
jgi:hypothetical protein